jgi:SAM-dependent methyltransferase
VSDEPVRLEDAYALQTPQDSRELYARWAATYESGFVCDEQYVIPQRVAEVFVDAFLGLDAHHVGGAILDVGCGTGLAGLALADLLDGVVVDGADISPEMLAVAAGKCRGDGSPLYRNLIEVDLTAPAPELAARGGSYAGLLSSGTFTHGHLGSGVLADIVAFARIGGLVAVGINAEHFAAHGFRDALDGLVKTGAITDLCLPVVEMYLPGSAHFGETAVVAVFSRAG